jgi:hypothetical protein
MTLSSMGYDVKSTPLEPLVLGTIDEVGIKLRDQHQRSDTVTG